MTRREHQALRRDIEPYLDGEVDEATAASVRRHLAECWPCSEDAEWIVLIKAALRRLGTRRPDELSAVRLLRFARSIDSTR